MVEVRKHFLLIFALSVVVTIGESVAALISGAGSLQKTPKFALFFKFLGHRG